MFCTSCGKKINDGDAFCMFCGAKQTSAAPVAPSAPDTSAPSMPDPAFERIKARYRCPDGHVFDATAETTVCPTCGKSLSKGGWIHLYRMGNYVGCAIGMGIYINGEAYGLIGNKESLKISLPYGTYTVHVTHTATRKCNDPMITVTPTAPEAFFKAHFSRGGFAIEVESADKKDMPTG